MNIKSAGKYYRSDHDSNGYDLCGDYSRIYGDGTADSAGNEQREAPDHSRTEHKGEQIGAVPEYGEKIAQRRKEEGDKRQISQQRAEPEPPCRIETYIFSEAASGIAVKPACQIRPHQAEPKET